MMRSTYVIVLVQAFVVAECYLGIFPEGHGMEDAVKRAEADDGGDPGEPLLLSPLIASGSLDEARRRARVTISPDLNIESYAGFLTVKKTYQSNHFFWFFPSIVEDSSTAPVLLWLQGGPGGSSLFGLFKEHGPFIVKNGTFERRKHTWALNHNIIYIDNPVGTGFSFTRDEQAYCRDEEHVAEDLYSSLTQFFQLFPELQRNSFYISGESYAGKYIPALAYAIHKKNPTAETEINLKGVAIGNGWCDPEHQLAHSEYFYQLGFVDWNVQKKIKNNEKETLKDIKKEFWLAARFEYFKIYSQLHMINLYNYLENRQKNDEEYVNALRRSSVRKSIHVGNITYEELSYSVYSMMGYDFMQSVAPLISELLEHYDVTFYNGQLDVLMTYPTTVNFLRSLPFSSSAEYATAPRFQWRVRGELAGYVKTAGRLRELLVRDAGHMVPSDQPAWAHDLITRITHDIPFHGNVDERFGQI